MYGLEPMSGPESEPVTTAEAKAWLRVEHTSDDSLIASLVSAARGAIEREIGRQLVSATWRLHLDQFPWPGGWSFLEQPWIPDPHVIRLPKAPLRSVEAVKWYDMTGNLNTLDPSTYVVDTKQDPGRIVLAMGKVWPVTLLRPGAVQVEFTAGYANASSVPEELKTAIKMMVAYLYENRGETGDTVALGVPLAVQRLLSLCWNGEREYGT